MIKWLIEMYVRQMRKAKDIQSLRFEHDNLSKAVMFWSHKSGDPDQLDCLGNIHDRLMARFAEVKERKCWCWPWQSLKEQVDE